MILPGAGARKVFTPRARGRLAEAIPLPGPANKFRAEI